MHTCRRAVLESPQSAPGGRPACTILLAQIPIPTHLSPEATPSNPPACSEEVLKQLAEQMQGLAIPEARKYYRQDGTGLGSGLPAAPLSTLQASGQLPAWAADPPRARTSPAQPVMP